MAENPMINKCLYQAEKLHKGVVYGGGLVMLDQVVRTADVLKESLEGSEAEKSKAVCVALLHKCFEPKRISEGVEPLTIEQVAHLGGAEVARVVAELATEPAESDSMSKARAYVVNEANIEKYLKDASEGVKQFFKDSLNPSIAKAECPKKTKAEEWQEKAEWAKTLSPLAQQVLLAEKVVNYEVSRDRPNMKKPLSWHKEYYETRQLMVEAIKEASPELYKVACQTKAEGLKQINMRVMAEQQRSGGRSM